MFISWTAKRKTIYFFLFLILAVFLAGLIWLEINYPSCSDGKQNQEEEGIDCGGPCEKICLGDIKNLIVSWVKAFSANQGLYDVVAMVDNPNSRLSASLINYRFKLYNTENNLIASRSGQAFVNPGEQFPIFESGIDTGGKIPARVFIEFQPFEWQFLEKAKHQLVVSKKEFINGPKPRLKAAVSNKSMLAEKNIDVAVLLYDENKNAIGASSSHIDYLAGGDSMEIVFTWPESLSQEPTSSEIFFRTAIVHMN